jgi:ATP-dependent helicase HrpA
VRAEDFDRASLDDHVRMRVEITDGERVLAAGRDPRVLFAAHRERSTQDFAAAVRDGAREARFEGHGRRGLLDMPIEPIPESIRFVHAGVPLLGHPALVDEGRSVRIEVFEGPDAARAAHRAGVRRLLVLRHRSALDHHVSYLGSFDALALAHAPLGPRDALRAALMNLAVDVGVLGQVEPPRDRVAFDALADRAADRLHEAVREAASIAEPLLRGFIETSKALDGHHPPSWEESIRSMRSELARLVPRDVFRSVPIERLRHTPRYLAALRVRLRRLAGAVDRDLERMAEIDEWVLRERELPPTADPAEAERFRFMLEEYRVQSFASELRTAIPVSRERLEAQWVRVRGDGV